MGILTHIRRCAILALLCASLLLAVLPARAQESSGLDEQKIKAGLVYNFLKYTTWPSSHDPARAGHLQVCLLGADSFAGYLSPLDGRTAQQLVISVTRIGKISDSAACHLLFVGRNMESALPDLLSFTNGKDVMTVSDIENFARKGGMVELSKENDFINIYINRKALGNAGLTVQSRLLKLAKSVSG